MKHDRHNFVCRVATLFMLAVTGLVGSMLAQHMGRGSHLNPVGEDQARKAASQLVIGMAQKDAIRLLATNGLLATSGERYTDKWFAIYCFTNRRCDLKLEFQQKPGPTGLVMQATADYSKMYTVETTNPFVVMTNGILKAALFQNVQIARTNAR